MRIDRFNDAAKFRFAILNKKENMRRVKFTINRIVEGIYLAHLYIANREK